MLFCSPGILYRHTHTHTHTHHTHTTKTHTHTHRHTHHTHTPTHTTHTHTPHTILPIKQAMYHIISVDLLHFFLFMRLTVSIYLGQIYNLFSDILIQDYFSPERIDFRFRQFQFRICLTIITVAVVVWSIVSVISTVRKYGSQLKPICMFHSVLRTSPKSYQQKV